MKISLHWLVFKTIFIICSVIYPASTKAQVVPDRTLSTDVNRNNKVLEITGGNTVKNNLFHSFEEFSVPTGLEAFFKNAANIENIFSRVTGENISNISGAIRANGNANLFLMNPNGIVFGKNAAINVGGSFIATTAESIEFKDDTSFSATDLSKPPLLTVEIPIGLGMGSNPGEIINRSQVVNKVIDSSEAVSSGLSVKEGRTLALIGGKITLEGGNLTAPSGRIELGSTTDNAVVGIDSSKNNLSFSYKNELFKNILIGNEALVSTSGKGNGSIQIVGNIVELNDASEILNDNSGVISSGDIIIKAIESIALKDLSRISSSVFSSGNGGNIIVDTKKLDLTGGSSVNAFTFDKGDTGNIAVRANHFNLSDLVVLSDEIRYSSVANRAEPGSTGNTGNINIATNKLVASNGADISIASFGAGNYGNLSISAKSLEFSGAFSLENSSISNRNFRSLPTVLEAIAAGEGDSGKVLINAEKISFTNGALIFAATFGSGKSATVNINVEEINFSGTSNDGQLSSGIFVSTGGESEGGSLSVSAKKITVSDGAEISGRTFGEAMGGNIQLDARDFLSLTNDSSVVVDSDSTGDAGELSINASEINIDKTSEISASTASGQGGNIRLNSDRLSLFNQSQISATARGEGDGGNIGINTENLVLDSSKIDANALEGKGGNITINTEVLFVSPDSNITATSELGIDGTIDINSPEISLQGQLEPREVEVVATEEALANSCLSRRDRRTVLTVGGSGALPRSPESNYSGTNFTLTGVQRLPQLSPEATKSPNTDSYRASQPAMIPADTLIETEDGKILLVNAKNSKAMPVFCES
ncbi:filamentous hemagglutinin N-terminal domain-containing protein [Myxosarcina sp. GI1]|uniref:two-partner secretion domain-containing protein n=1 Tax=Myxosarcina sp. GI1 TaxID=1541065 RepID=UPI0012E019F9|nr:filamentous hemagglutinin N-terminal domain-containing protein [Myxosarcina sp. GI1]